MNHVFCTTMFGNFEVMSFCDSAIREHADSGKPTLVADPDGRVSAIYKQIARRCAVRIAESQKDMTSKFPNIVVQNT